MPLSTDILILSSYVARGSVGLRAQQFCLERLGHTVWAIPTVQLAHHPARAPVTAIVPDELDLAKLLGELVELPERANIAAIITGYFASPEQISMAGKLIDDLKSQRSDILYFCDPVLGDKGRLYIDQTIARAIKSELLPRADWLLPNLFELSWLSGLDDLTVTDCRRALDGLKIEKGLISSVPAMRTGSVAALAIDGLNIIIGEHPILDGVPKGTGDLLSALFTHHCLDQQPLHSALEKSLSSIYEVAATSVKLGTEELVLTKSQSSFTQLNYPISLQSLAL